MAFIEDQDCPDGCTIDFSVASGYGDIAKGGMSLLIVYFTVWLEGFLYKVALPELKISPIMYFVMYNSIVQAKVPKIIVPLKQNFEKLIFTI